MGRFDTDGQRAALFYVSLSNANKPKEEKKVLWAGQVLTVGISRNGDLFLLHLTANNNVTFSSETRESVEKGRCALFHTRAFPSDDSRNLKAWNKWNKTETT